MRFHAEIPIIGPDPQLFDSLCDEFEEESSNDLGGMSFPRPNPMYGDLTASLTEYQRDVERISDYACIGLGFSTLSLQEMAKRGVYTLR
jgi:hypothetical protein